MEIQDAHVLADLDLSRVSLLGLCREVKRRGLDVLPAGMWEREITRREQELTDLKAREVEAKAAIPDGYVDGTEVCKELREIASERYPALVKDWIAQSQENTALQQRLTFAEREVTALCALVLAELDEDRSTEH
jgi:hypothetical protein